MTTATGDLAEQSAGRDFVRDWQAVRDNGDIQYAPVELPKQPEMPEWLRRVLEAVGHALEAVFKFIGEIGKAIGLTGPALIWVLAAIAAVLAALLIWRIVRPRLRVKPVAEDEAEEWKPDSAAAIGLLDEADRLAAQGRFEEATHLLLQRSVFQIHQARPGLLDPSSTAREIAVLPALPEGARRAFAVIAERVERSLFALRGLSAEDWHAARAAYAGFALDAPGAPA